jgi:hypothetical protein
MEATQEAAPAIPQQQQEQAAEASNTTSNEPIASVSASETLESKTLFDFSLFSSDCSYSQLYSRSSPLGKLLFTYSRYFY